MSKRTYRIDPTGAFELTVKSLNMEKARKPPWLKKRITLGTDIQKVSVLVRDALRLVGSPAHPRAVRDADPGPHGKHQIPAD